MRLQAGAIRELHWHVPSEWAYVTYGVGRVTAVDPDGRKFVIDQQKFGLVHGPPSEDQLI